MSVDCELGCTRVRVDDLNGHRVMRCAIVDWSYAELAGVRAQLTASDTQLFAYKEKVKNSVLFCQWALSCGHAFTAACPLFG